MITLPKRLSMLCEGIDWRRPCVPLSCSWQSENAMRFAQIYVQLWKHCSRVHGILRPCLGWAQHYRI
jgi:hypothetical protein